MAKSEYKKELDVVVATMGTFTVKDADGDSVKRTVNIRQYDGGQLKVAVEGKNIRSLRIPLSLLQDEKFQKLLGKAMEFKPVKAEETPAAAAKVA